MFKILIKILVHMYWLYIHTRVLIQQVTTHIYKCDKQQNIILYRPNSV